MIVADTMVLAYLFLPHPQFAAEIERAQEKDPVWTAPPLWRSELRSALMQYVRSVNADIPGADLVLPRAVEIMRDAEVLLKGRTFDVDSEDVLHLADRSGLSPFDCEYVALALDLNVRLLTYDQPVLKAFPEVGVRPSDFDPTR